MDDKNVHQFMMFIGIGSLLMNVIIYNHLKVQRTHLVLGLKGHYRWGLTGTPFEKNTSQMHSILTFLKVIPLTHIKIKFLIVRKVRITTYFTNQVSLIFQKLKKKWLL